VHGCRISSSLPPFRRAQSTCLGMELHAVLRFGSMSQSLDRHDGYERPVLQNPLVVVPSGDFQVIYRESCGFVIGSTSCRRFSISGSLIIGDGDDGRRTQTDLVRDLPSGCCT